MENKIKELEQTVLDLVEITELLQNQISGHTQILKLITNYEEE
tara:strand:+ start:1908 stop:2036 length:129 start_codon:yes stop_codon:yes gene_type:complete